MKADQISFILFIAALALLIVMAIVPGSSKEDRKFASHYSTGVSLKKTPPPREEEIIEEKEEAGEENFRKEKVFIFPEVEEEWIPLLKRHLWRVAYSDKPDLVQGSKLFLQKVPKDIVEEHVEALLESEQLSEQEMGAIAVRYIGLKSLLPKIYYKIPRVEEENIVPKLSLYLLALSIGDQESGPHLLPYAVESLVLSNRFAALESLTQIRFSDCVPLLLKKFLSFSKQNIEYDLIMKVIVASITREQYPLLIECYNSNNAKQRKSVLLMMRQIDLPYFVEYYKKGLEDSNWPIRNKSYLSFIELQDASAFDTLLAKATHKNLDRNERILALESAGYCAEKQKPERFDRFLEEKDPILCFIARTNQIYLHDLRAIPGLIELLETKENQFIVGQGSDLEEENSWFQEQLLHVLTNFTGKEFEHSFQWVEWWKKEKKFRFPDFEFSAKRPKLYYQR